MDLGDRLMSVKKMKEVFRKHDTDGDGTISRDSLEQILRKLCPGISQIDLDLIFRKVDKNFNNLIEYDEFVNLLFFDPTAEEKRTASYHVTREAAWILFHFWQIAVQAPLFVQVETAESETLLEAVRLSSDVMDSLRHRIQKLEGEHFQLVSKAEQKMVARITSKEVMRHLEEVSAEINQEQFVRMIWPRIKKFDLRFVLGCFRRFWAQEGLSEILRVVSHHRAGKPAADIPVAHLKQVFDVLDEDDDGALSIKEMVQQGALEVNDALKLSEMLDKGQDGDVSLQELMNLAVGTDGEVMESFKGLFAARLSASSS